MRLQTMMQLGQYMLLMVLPMVVVSDDSKNEEWL